MRLLIYNDLHNSDIPPVSRTDYYTEDILDKMRQIYDIGKQANVNYFVNTGDVFHIKVASRVSHWLVQRILEIFNKSSALTLLLPGGHDLSHGRLESLRKQPFGVISKSKRVMILDSAGKGEISFNNDTFSYVSVPGLPKFENALSAEDILSLGDADILIAHAPIARPGDKYPFPTMDAGDLATHYRLVMYGHMHRDVGVYKIGSTIFCCFGAVSRGSLTEVNLARIPRVVLLDMSRDKQAEGGIKISYNPVELKVRPSGIAFRLDEVRQAESVKEEINEFLSKLKSVELVALDKEAVIGKIKIMDSVSEQVKKTAIEILEYA